MRKRNSVDKAAVDLSLRRDVYERLQIYAEMSTQSESAIVELALRKYFDLIDSCDPQTRELVRLLTSNDD